MLAAIDKAAGKKQVILTAKRRQLLPLETHKSGNRDEIDDGKCHHIFIA